MLATSIKIWTDVPILSFKVCLKKQDSLLSPYVGSPLEKDDYWIGRVQLSKEARLVLPVEGTGYYSFLDEDEAREWAEKSVWIGGRGVVVRVLTFPAYAGFTDLDSITSVRLGFPEESYRGEVFRFMPPLLEALKPYRFLINTVVITRTEFTKEVSVWFDWAKLTLVGGGDAIWRVGRTMRRERVGFDVARCFLSYKDAVREQSFGAEEWELREWLRRKVERMKAYLDYAEQVFAREEEL